MPWRREEGGNGREGSKTTATFFAFTGNAVPLRQVGSRTARVVVGVGRKQLQEEEVEQGVKQQ